MAALPAHPDRAEPREYDGTRPAGVGKVLRLQQHQPTRLADRRPDQRAVLFYNRQTHTPGLLTRYDLLVLDEAQSLQFSNPGEIQAQLKGYLEQGVYARGDCAATAECGLMLLANIDIQPSPVGRYRNGKPAFLPRRKDYIRRLPDFLLESPLVDRFHGIIPGWKIPPFETTQQAQGYGLKADYFAEVCHALRAASDISQTVRARLRLSGGKRDCTAIERLACGLAKLLLIGPDDPRFEDLVVQPAEKMRQNVRSQLHELDPDGYAAELTEQPYRARPGPEQGAPPAGALRSTRRDRPGGFAQVYKGVDTRSGTVVAVKMATTGGKPDDERAIRREMDIYERLKLIPNAHLLAVRDIFREEGRYALVTEYADGGTLWDLTEGDTADGPRKAMDEATAKQISLAILDGLSALHENDIVHRDIKPENVLRCDDDWKIADFGISKLRSSPVTGFTMQGAHSMPWAPPEQREGASGASVRRHLRRWPCHRVPAHRVGEGRRLLWPAGELVVDHQALSIGKPGRAARRTIPPHSDRRAAGIKRRMMSPDMRGRGRR